MIFVVLAIAMRLWAFFSIRISPVSASISTALLAESAGAAIFDGVAPTLLIPAHVITSAQIRRAIIALADFLGTDI